MCVCVCVGGTLVSVSCFFSVCLLISFINCCEKIESFVKFLLFIVVGEILEAPYW